MLYGNTGCPLVMSIFSKYGNLEQNARSGEMHKVADIKDGETVEAVVEGSEANWGAREPANQIRTRKPATNEANRNHLSEKSS